MGFGKEAFHLRVLSPGREGGREGGRGLSLARQHLEADRKGGLEELQQPQKQPQEQPQVP